MGIAIAGLVVTIVALIVSLGFNYAQYKWREEEREQREKDRTEAKGEQLRKDDEQLRKDDEQLRKERMPPEFYNMGGTPNPIRIPGSQHSVQGPFVHVWGFVTVVNPTQSPMKISPQTLVINGAEWETKLTFHPRANPGERYDRISMVGNAKQDYELHFLFPEDKCPKAMSGELRMTSSNREDEPFSIPVSFS